MQDYHIYPDSQQAADAAPHVAAYDRDDYIAIRGDEHGFDRVVRAPDDWQNPSYLWVYVRAGDWLDEFHA